MRKAKEAMLLIGIHFYTLKFLKKSLRQVLFCCLVVCCFCGFFLCVCLLKSVLPGVKITETSNI